MRQVARKEAAHNYDQHEKSKKQQHAGRRLFWPGMMFRRVPAFALGEPGPKIFDFRAQLIFGAVRCR
jgi:hypothetical protein